GIGTAREGTFSVRSGCTMTAPAEVSDSAARYFRLSRKLTSSGRAICNGATPVSSRSPGGAGTPPPAAPGPRPFRPVRRKNRGSPAIGGQFIAPHPAVDHGCFCCEEDDVAAGGLAGGLAEAGAPGAVGGAPPPCDCCAIAIGDTPSGGMTTDARILF